LRDFLTVTFSHSSTDGFLMWGFWDGNHWFENAPMFNLDWSIKPSGQAFLDLVFDEWWTDETHQTDAAGQATVRGFKGRYELVTDCGSELRRDTISLSAALDLNIDCPNLVVGTQDFSAAGLRVYPNPARARFVLEQTTTAEGQLDLYAATGQRVAHWRVAAQRTELPLDVPPGLYWLQWRSAGITYQHRLVVR